MAVAEPLRQPSAAPLRPVPGRLTCPNCERTRPEWHYSRLQRVGKYVSQTVEVYRCPEPRCRHVFGLHPERG